MAHDLFFGSNLLDEKQVSRLLDDALHGSDDGELFLEHTLSEQFTFDDNRLRAAQYDTAHGFGMRAISGELTAYAHSTTLTPAALARAAETVKMVHRGDSAHVALDDSRKTAPPPALDALYGDENPLESHSFAKKLKLLEEINAYARARDNRVRQVSISLAGEWQSIAIIRPDARPLFDIRPLVRLDVSVVVGESERQETGHSGRGGRNTYAQWVAPENWRAQVNAALKQALTNLESIAAPAGEMNVVLGAGWPGILLHEAVGHGLEGDFNRKKTSAFSGRIGTRVAAPGVCVVDDGTIPNRRGSLTIDDEGTPSQHTTLIEDGILKAYMQDRMNARLMKQKPTGNGRRENFACQPLPRMTNTYMNNGQHTPEEIIASVKNGIYAVSFGGGQVDITSGKFVFSCTEAYELKNGRIGHPLKGATLIGTGPDSMQRIAMIGNDMTLDEGIGTCGKDGQGVPVGVGQPTLRIDGITVGGTG